MKKTSLYILFISIFVFTLSCQPEEDSSQADLSEQYQASWQVVDSFVYKLDLPDHLYSGHPWVFGGRFIYNHQFKSEILEFDRNGKLLHKMGRAGSGPGEFGETSYCTGDDSLIVVIDRILGKVQMFGKSGKSLGENLYSSGTEEEPYSINAPFEEIHYCGNGEFAAFIVSRRYRADMNEEFYARPCFARFDTTGYMLSRFGTWDSIYIQKKFLIYMMNIQFTFDIHSDHFFSTQEPVHTISEHDRLGAEISTFGFEGKYVTSAEIVSGPPNTVFRDLPVVLHFNAYQDIHATQDHIIRFYRTALSEEETHDNTYRWDMPYYYQVYDRSGNLLADNRAPSDWFFIRGSGKEDGSFWVMNEGAYDEEAYSHKMYKYQLVVAKK